MDNAHILLGCHLRLRRTQRPYEYTYNTDYLEYSDPIDYTELSIPAAGLHLL